MEDGKASTQECEIFKDVVNDNLLDIAACDFNVQKCTINYSPKKAI